MDFSLSDKHRMVVQMVRDFGEKEVAPTIQEWDRMQEMAPHILPRLAELGMLGVCIPERYGSSGCDYVTLALPSHSTSWSSRKSPTWSNGTRLLACSTCGLAGSRTWASATHVKHRWQSGMPPILLSRQPTRQYKSMALTDTRMNTPLNAICAMLAGRSLTRERVRFTS